MGEIILNKVVLIGNLTRDPDVRNTQSGVSVCTFTLAVQSRYKETADFINVVAWRGLAETCGRYLKKGSKACVCGALQSRSYEAKDGSKRTVVEVIADEVEFLSFTEKKEAEPVGEPIDDELPF